MYPRNWFKICIENLSDVTMKNRSYKAFKYCFRNWLSSFRCKNMTLLNMSPSTQDPVDGCGDVESRQNFNQRHVSTLVTSSMVRLKLCSLAATTSAAPQRPDGLLPVCIQSRFMRCTRRNAVEDTSCTLSPKSNSSANLGEWGSYREIIEM